MTPNTSILSHQYAWSADGKEHELFARVKESELTTQRMLAHFKACLKLTKSQIREQLLLPEDKWLSAQEALEMGICDAVKSL